ncbi:SPOR domain-containing protein [Sphingobium sp.]|uniref:SPOR domain-containing protein n=1 Tax=Sphingobium sp. TaxID=1912891 RepID=UPI0026241000|nr:SPOR domain-containing protein [Sphingobium sp.]
MRSNNKALAALIAAAFSAMAAIAEAQPAAMVEDQPVLLGEAYNVAGVLYRPADPAAYDEVGYAAAMAEGSQGAKTANGEAFADDAITAAHKTLPLPSYVEVTALDSGRTILARVNDRGPMRNDRLIGLSPGAMAQLRLAGPSAAVRVRRVNPPGQDQVALRSHQRAAERLESPPALLKVLREKLQPSRSPITQSEKEVLASKAAASGRPGATFDPAPADLKPAAPPVTPAAAKPEKASGRYFVQVGAFSSRANAQRLAKRIGAQVEQGGGLWRVRYGPYTTRQAAQAGVRAAAAQGFANMPIMAKDEP